MFSRSTAFSVLLFISSALLVTCVDGTTTSVTDFSTENDYITSVTDFSTGNDYVTSVTDFSTGNDYITSVTDFSTGHDNAASSWTTSEPQTTEQETTQPSTQTDLPTSSWVSTSEVQTSEPQTTQFSAQTDLPTSSWATTSDQQANQALSTTDLTLNVNYETSSTLDTSTETSPTSGQSPATSPPATESPQSTSQSVTETATSLSAVTSPTTSGVAVSSSEATLTSETGSSQTTSQPVTATVTSLSAGTSPTTSGVIVSSSSSDTTSMSATTSTVSSNSPEITTIQSSAGADSSTNQWTIVTPASTPGTSTTPTSSGKPGNLENIVYNLTFSLIFNRTWNGDLEDPGSREYSLISSDLSYTVKEAFTGSCYGFKDVIVLNFSLFDENSTAATFDANLARNQTKAFYKTTYDPKAAVTNSSGIISDITNKVIGRLAASLVGVYGIDDSLIATMLGEVAEQNNTFYTSPCQLRSDVCAPCYNCSDNLHDPNNMCTDTCTKSYQYCLVMEGTEASGCSCQQHYLLVAGDCVHENWIIGLTAGIGGAILLGLLIAVIVLSCSHHSSSHSNKSRLSDSDIHHSTAAMFTAIDSEAGHHNNYSAVNDYDDAERRSTGEQLNTFGKAAAAVAVAQADVLDEKKDAPHQQPESHGPGSQPAAAAAVVVAAAATQSHNQQPEPDYPPVNQGHNSSPYYNQDPFGNSTFVPQLQNVDPYRNYAIKRPTALATPASKYQNNAYNSDFF